MSAEAIRIRNVNVTLGGRRILTDINLDIPSGSITAMIGPNGAGKTTLLRVILGQIPYSGSVEFPQYGNLRPKIGYIPQSVDIERENPITVADFLVLNIQRRPLWLGINRELSDRMEKALGRTGTSGLLKSPIGKLSGGEMQRVLLSKILLDKPNIVLMDEPVSGIDIAGEKVFCELLDELHSEFSFTLVLISHDLSVVSNHSTHLVCINRKIRCVGPSLEVLTPENIHALFGPDSFAIKHHDHFKAGGHSPRV